MKLIFAALVMFSFTAQASPVLNVKERLRIHLWINGMEEKPQPKKVQAKHLPEEIERPLRKI